MIKRLKQYGRNGHYYKLIHRLFGVWASNIELYKLALVHRSASVIIENQPPINNERLEFLGDSVIQLVVSEMLFLLYPSHQEGELSQFRSKIIRRKTMNYLAEQLDFRDEIFCSSTNQPDILGNTFEALCGALYLDSGFDTTSTALLHLFSNHLDLEDTLLLETDHKSRLLEFGQQQHKSVVFNTSTAATNTRDSSNGTGFRSEVSVDGVLKGVGEGVSKKSAEQCAAMVALHNLRSSSSL